MLEVGGQDRLLEPFHVLYDEGLPFRGPRHDVRVVLVFQDVVGFLDEVADGLLAFPAGLPHFRK